MPVPDRRSRPHAPHAARWLGAALLLASLALLGVGAGVGSAGWDGLAGWSQDAVARQILWDIRLPRTLGAWLAGALLALAGAVAQGLFRNPLADPYLLGSASGAALGSALAMVWAGTAALGMAWVAQLGMTGMAFIGAALAVALTMALAQGVENRLRLLLSGVVVGVVLGAVRDLLELRYPEILQPMKAFGLGSTALVGWPAVALMAGAMVLSWGLAVVMARVLDALALGEATATSLGLPLAPLRLGLVGVMALVTGAAVAHTGLIAFVGLAAPHLVRSLFQGRHAVFLSLSALMGGGLLLGADILARWLMAPQELPVGVLTALLGGSYLLWLMRRTPRKGLQ